MISWANNETSDPIGEVVLCPGDLQNVGQGLEALVPNHLMQFARDDEQRSIPAIAKDADASASIERVLCEMPTTHRLLLGDSRKSVAELPEKSIHLAITSPPYWILKEYEDHPDQLGHVDDYEEFLNAIDIVWESVRRALVPGGRLVIVVGDVCLSRRPEAEDSLGRLNPGDDPDQRQSLFPSDLTEVNDNNYSEPSLDLNVSQFLTSLLRAVVLA